MKRKRWPIIVVPLGLAAVLLRMTLVEPAHAETSAALARRIHLADGFEARVLMVQGKRFTRGGDYPGQPDLITVFPQADGGTTLYISHELSSDGPVGAASLSEVVLDASGKVVESGTVVQERHNLCSGTVTPWGTVLTCEEFPRPNKPQEGYVWEFDPKTKTITRLDALGRFSHESAAFDAAGNCVLTEDEHEGGHLYRFIPKPKGQLKAGILEVLNPLWGRWVKIGDPKKAGQQARSMGGWAELPRPEGIDPWPGGGFAVALTGLLETKHRFGRIVRFHPERGTLTDILRCGPDTIIQPDNLRFRPNGWLYVCEDRYPEHLSAYGPNRVVAVSHDGKKIKVLATASEGEVSGVVFHPDGKRCYINIMHETESLTLEIIGPFATLEAS